MKPIPSDSSDQHVLGVHCPVPDSSCQAFHASLPSTTSIQESRGHRSSKQINSTLEITGFAQKRADRFGMNTFLQQSRFNIIVFDTVKPLSTSPEATKAPTLHSAALLRTCLSVAVTPAVDLPGSLPKMFVSCGSLSRLTAVCKARL